MDHRLSDELQPSKRSLKRSKSESVRQKRPVKTSSHPQFENNSGVINSNHSRKRPSTKSKITRRPGLVTASFDREKFSSSSSYDRLPCGEVNSPGSGTESSCSAPSKLVENPSSVLPERNLFENLEKDFAPSAPKVRRVGDYNPSQNRSVSSLLKEHPQSYPSSPASPNIDRKEATYVPPNVHSSRKQVSIKTDNQDDHSAACVSSRQPPQQQIPNDFQYHGKMRSQFDSFPPTSFNNKQRNHHHRLPQRCQNSPETNSVETVDLVSDDGSHESDYEIPNFYIPTDKSISYHSAQTSQYSLGRQQTSRSTSILRNGFKSALQDYTHLSKVENSWDPPNLPSSSDFWNSRNSLPGRESGSHYDNFDSMRPNQADKRGSFTMHNQALRNSSVFEQTSKGMVLGQSQRQNDTEINLLKQCGCVEMGDVRCKNNIFCQIHSWEEKKRVQRPRELKEILNNLRQQRIMGMLSESSRLRIQRLPQPSTSVVSNPHPSTSTSITSSAATASRANPVPQGLSSGVSLNSSARRVPISNGSVVGSSSRQQQQKPTIVHRLHNIPNLLQRTSTSSNTAVVWGQDGALPSFIHSSGSAQVSSLPPPSGFPPGSSSSSNSAALAKVARKTPHIELSAGAPELQNRVVVNDEREKSITGRSRKASRSNTIRRNSSLQNPYYQRYTATQNRANPTGLVLRASPSSSQLPAKIRTSATGRESGNSGSSLASSATATSSSPWLTYNNSSTQRSISVSDLHSLQQHQASGSTMSSSLSRHSNSPNTTASHTLSGASSATVVGRHSTGSSRYIVIGANNMRKSGLTVLPSQSLFQQQQQQHPNCLRQLPATTHISTVPFPTPLSPPTTSLDSLPRELPGETEVSSEQEERGDEFLFNSDASAEAAAAVANLEAESSSGFEVDDVDMYLNHHNPSPQQQQQTQTAHFSRSAAAGATTSGQMLAFQTRRM
nr:conserved hypothetical protein [Hymenolepis microstoma]